MARPIPIKGLPFRLYGLTALFGVGLIALGSASLWFQWNGAREARVGRLMVLTEVATKIIDSNRALAMAGEMPEESAKARALAQVTAATYGKGDYFSVVDVATGKMIAHANAKQVGTSAMDTPDATGFKFIADVVPRAVRDGAATVSYSFPRAGEQVALPKLTVYRHYVPWNWAVGTGTYLDDLQAEFWGNAAWLAAVAGGVLLVLSAMAGGIVRSIVRPTASVVRSMQDLATGNTDVALPDGGALNETRAMAASVAVFKQAAIEKARVDQEMEAGRRAADLARARQQEAAALAAQQQAAVVDALASGMDRLAGGDVTVRLSSAFAPEYERLRGDFNRTAERLAATIGAIAGSSSALRTGAAEITHAADDLSRRTEQQAASLEETAAALEQITATVGKAADAARHAREIVAGSQAGAQQSSQVVLDAVAAMNNIEQSAREISQIIGVIDEIAFQTNLLALNAGVEAARAGDAGRGFAVVASEVRALAQRSTQAAKEIKALILTSTEQVGRGVALVGATGKSLAKIIAEVDDINRMMGEIALSAQEQASGLNEVSKAVSQMDQITQQNAAMVEQSTAASHALAHEVNELDRLTGFFQTEAA